jgi:hypothetical protein
MGRPSESELKEQAERKAKDLLRENPEPVIPQVASNFAQMAEENAALDKEQERAEDQLSTDALRRQVAEMRELFEKQTALVTRLLGKAGFRENDERRGAEVFMPADTPLDAIITIFILEGATPAEKEPVLLGINGRQRFVPRGRYIQVTKSELGILQDAVYEGEEYPVDNDTPLARRVSSAYLTPSVPVKYRKPRFHFMVSPGPLPT